MVLSVKRVKSRFALLLIALLIGCNAAPSITTTDTDTIAAIADIPATENTPAIILPSVPTATATTLPLRVVATPLSEEREAEPVEVVIASLQLTIPVLPMRWKVVDSNGQRHTEWELPMNEAGWHPNSAKPGTNGTVIISGHHRLGNAVFASIAQGGVQQGMEIDVRDALDQIWRYYVVEVSQPIPVEGATADEKARFDSYLRQSQVPRLVLLTGWPEFSDTHYLAVIAEMIQDGNGKKIANGEQRRALTG